jgi:outer membrane protein OmpA-like peptidoglycan-associated protein
MPEGNPAMKKLHRMITVVLAIVGAAAALAACAQPTALSSGDSPGPAVMPVSCGTSGSLVLALPSHANTPQAVLTAAMQQSLADAIKTKAAVGLVNIDGKPSLAQAGAFSSDAGNAAAREQDAATFSASLNGAAAKLKATTPHVDDLEALRVAGATVHAGCPTGGTLYFEDSGLQDTGILDFTKSDLLEAQPAEIVTFLKQNGALPDLTGVHVVLTGLGDTEAPQEPLDTRLRTNLVATWTAIVKASGAASVTVDPTPIETDPNAAARGDLPKVTPVKIPGLPKIPVKPRGVTVLPQPDSGPLGFQPDETVFRDPAAASQALDALAKQLNSLEAAHVTVMGTTSSAGTEDGRLALSRERAGKVRDELVKRGVPAGWFTVKGVGTHFKAFQPDTDAAGHLLPGPAQQNRSVVITVDAS